MPQHYSYKTELHSPVYGYLQIIDYDSLYEIAKEHDLIVVMTKEIGRFVINETTLAVVYHETDKELPHDLIDAITIGNERNAKEDVQYTVQKLEEIALRAISTGINDPHTAIDCIQHLGKILLMISRYHKDYLVYVDGEQSRVVSKQRQLKDILYQSFYQIIICMDDDVSILFVLMDTLILIGENSQPRVRRMVLELYQYMKAHFNISNLKPLDYHYFEQKEKQILELDKIS